MELVIPRCPIFGKCGGCQLQHMKYADQLWWKFGVVQDALRKIAHIRVPKILPVIGMANPWNYRTRITLHCDRQGRVGFYKKKSHEASEFSECPIAAPEINARLAEEKAKIAGRPGHYEVRLDEGDGFTQINPEQNRALRKLVGEGLQNRPCSIVVELFCGNGNFSFEIAPYVGRHYGCDTHSGSIDAAIARTKTEKVRNVRFAAAGSYGFLRELQRGGVRPDGMVLDPPRRGAAEIVPVILEMLPQWICYISCDPTTLARDLKVLTHGGYTLESAQPVDMFPQTDHIETVCWLSR